MTIDTATLSPRNAAIVGALVVAAQDPDNQSGQLTIDTLRRKCQTTKANVVEALIELTGAFEEIEFDADGQTAMIDQDTEFDDIENLPDGPADYDEQAAVEAEQQANMENVTDEPVSAFRFPAKHKAIYEERGGNCGDALAEALTNYLDYSHDVPRKDGKGTKKHKGIDLHACEEVAEANGIAWQTVKGNNNGQLRMNLSNMLRSKWRKGQDIRVGEATIAGLASYKSRKQWIAECAAAYQAETKCAAAVALTQAEAEWEANAAGAEYDPTIGDFRF